MTDIRIKLPHNFEYRDYQLPLRNYMMSGGKRACAVWHRRAGKDTVALRVGLELAVQRSGNYWHMLPNAAQARKAIWHGINPHSGRKILEEVFPRELVKNINPDGSMGNTTEMRIDLKPGAVWNLVGSDNFDSLVGSPPCGVVFSEWAVADPRAWGYIEPILLENDGWAIFISTPRGENHLFKTYQTAMREEAWFGQRLTVDDTFRKDGSPLISAEQIRTLRREAGVTEAFIQQEYFSSFDAPLIGSYYADLLLDAKRDGRISEIPHDPAHLVSTAWDIGHHDATAIWWYQDIGHARHWIDYYENTGYGVEHYAHILRKRGEERKYEYGAHYGPHDLDNHDWGIIGGRTRKDIARQLGIRFVIVAKVSVEDGIQALRSLLPRSWFDAKRCEQGLNALRSYRREEDPSKAQTTGQPFYRAKPLHDWSSHGSDAARYAALAEKKRKGKRKPIEYKEPGAPL